MPDRHRQGRPRLRGHDGLRRRQGHRPGAGRGRSLGRPRQGGVRRLPHLPRRHGRTAALRGPQADGGTLEASGVGFTKEAAAALNQSLNTIKAAGTAVNGGISDPPPAADGAALQAELTELLGRSGINFAPTSAVIDAKSKAVLDTAAQGILAGPAVQIEIGGHTDSTGPAAQNQALSLQRAQAVRTYLIQKGVPAARLTAVGYGATKPIADNATPEGRARNRRIEFTVKQ